VMSSNLNLFREMKNTDRQLWDSASKDALSLGAPG